jgi:hypothetical protein
VEHVTDELDTRRLIRVCFLKVHDEAERAVFEGCVCRADDDRIPAICQSYVPSFYLPLSMLEESSIRGWARRAPVSRAGDKGESYQVMTLSAMGEADTPAGGSVCMRCVSPVSPSFSAMHQSCCMLHIAARVAYLEVAHQTAAGGCRHCSKVAWVDF